MSFFYIRQQGKDRIPLWKYTIVNEFSTQGGGCHQLRSPGRIATTSDGLLYITNDREGEITVADETTLELKGVKYLVPEGSNGGSNNSGATSSRSSPQWLGVPTSIGSDPSNSPSVCILPTSKLQDTCNLHTLTANDNGCFLKVSSANLGHWNGCSVCFGPEGELLVGNSRYNKVYTYNMTSGFTGDMEVDCKPSCLAYDRHLGRLHVCDSTANNVKVFSEVGGLALFEYGRTTLVVPQQIAIDSNSCSYVVCSFTVSCFLSVFDCNGDHIFNVYGFEGPSGVAVSPDQNSVWVSDVKKNCLVKFDGLCNLRPPFSMELYCQKSIFLHMSELSLSQLPTKLAKVFGSWTQPVKLDIKGLLPGGLPLTMTLILKHGLKTDIIKWMICKRLNLPEQVKMSFKNIKGTRLTHVTQLAYYMDSLTVILLSSASSFSSPKSSSTSTNKSSKTVSLRSVITK